MLSKAESVLKSYLKAYKNKDSNLSQMELRAQVALNICQRKLRDLDELLDNMVLIIR